MIRILLAEDTRDMNRALTALLTHEKYTVDSVFDGEEALDHLRQNAYDAVILDIMMPKKTVWRSCGRSGATATPPRSCS